MVSQPDGDYQVSFLDITQLDEARKIITTRHPKGVDLVMAACIYRDTETALPRVDGKYGGDNRTPPGVRTILSLSQILLALDHLQNEGHFVFVLSNKPDPATIQVLVFLRSLFKSVVPCKGKNLHGIRSSFYLFCDMFDRAAYEAQNGSQVLKDALRKVDEADVVFQTETLTVEEQQPKSAAELVHPADVMWLPGLTLETMLEREGEYVSRFFEKLWLGQIKAIDRRMQELEYRRKPNSNRFGGQGHPRREEQQPPSAALEANDWRSSKPSPSRSNWQAPSTAGGQWQDAPRRKSHQKPASTPTQPRATPPAQKAGRGPPGLSPTATRTTILPNNAIPHTPAVIPIKPPKSKGSSAFDWSQRPLGKELPH